MEFADNSFDGVYAIDATLYAKDPIDVYSEVSTDNIHVILTLFRRTIETIAVFCTEDSNPDSNPD